MPVRLDTASKKNKKLALNTELVSLAGTTLFIRTGCTKDLMTAGHLGGHVRGAPLPPSTLQLLWSWPFSWGSPASVCSSCAEWEVLSAQVTEQKPAGARAHGGDSSKSIQKRWQRQFTFTGCSSNRAGWSSKIETKWNYRGEGGGDWEWRGCPCGINS